MRKTIIIGLVLSFLLLTGCRPIPKKVEVPNLIGIELESAIELVESKSLNPDALKGEAAPQENLEDIVYWQAPDAGTRVKKGSIVNFIFYDEMPVQVRKMSILGTCLPGCEHMMKDLGFTHAYGNAFDWPDYSTLRELGLKAFICISAEEPEDEAYVRMIVEQYKDDPVTGGYWNEAMGHEPDIVGVSIEKRKWFYDLVRSIDPDKFNHPVMEMFNMTRVWDAPDPAKDQKIREWEGKYPELIEFRMESVAWRYPGWENAFSNETHDLLLFDCYPQVHRFDADIELGFAFIDEFADTHQAIPQMKAFFDEGEYMPDFLIKQYNAWKEKYQEFDNPYKEYVAVGFYKDETIRQSGDFQEQIRRINEEVMSR